MNAPIPRRRTSRHSIPKVRGVIVQYNWGQGTILLAGDGMDGLKESLERSPDAIDRMWFAWFDWNSIFPNDKSQIVELRPSAESLSERVEIQRGRDNKWLYKFLVGRWVTCDLNQQRASCVRVNFDQSPMSIPRLMQRRLEIAGEAPCSYSPTAIRRRFNRLTRNNNAKRPWGGMTE